jgi:hypothetical protein
MNSVCPSNGFFELDVLPLVLRNDTFLCCREDRFHELCCETTPTIAAATAVFTTVLRNDPFPHWCEDRLHACAAQRPLPALVRGPSSRLCCATTPSCPAATGVFTPVLRNNPFPATQFRTARPPLSSKRPVRAE